MRWKNASRIFWEIIFVEDTIIFLLLFHKNEQSRQMASRRNCFSTNPELDGFECLFLNHLLQYLKYICHLARTFLINARRALGKGKFLATASFLFAGRSLKRLKTQDLFPEARSTFLFQTWFALTPTIRTLMQYKLKSDLRCLRENKCCFLLLIFVESWLNWCGGSVINDARVHVSDREQRHARKTRRLSRISGHLLPVRCTPSFVSVILLNCSRWYFFGSLTYARKTRGERNCFYTTWSVVYFLFQWRIKQSYLILLFW